MEIISGRYKAIITREPERLQQAFLFRQKIFNKSNSSVDIDCYDEYCDHILVYYNDDIVGNYRVLLPENLPEGRQLYTATEFDISNILKEEFNNICEVGRSCVDKNHRNGVVINLLWKAVINFALQNGKNYLIGCASFDGVDIKKHEESLSYIFTEHLADNNILSYGSNDCYHHKDLDNSRVLKQLPPLIKGYISLGTKFGKGFYIDNAFNSIDVCIIFNINNMSDRYKKRLLI